MNVLLLVLFAIAWVALPGALIGWISGFFNWQIGAAILWGLFVLYTYPRSRRRIGGKGAGTTSMGYIMGDFTNRPGDWRLRINELKTDSGQTIGPWVFNFQVP